MKKGQITVFVIIGIILIVAIGLVIFAQRETVLAPVEAERVRVAEVPQTVQPIQNFVSDCLYTVSKQGLEIIGERGGYIDTRQLSFNPVEPTASEAVQFAPDSELKIPYWWHLKSKNSCESGCEFASERPDLTGGPKSIAGQLDSYIAAMLPSCLRNFNEFKEQQFEITAGAISPKTEITQRNVIVLLEMPLEITRGGEKFSIKDYAAELPVNLYEVYELATNITNLQAEEAILEHATRSLIDSFGRTSSRALPPVTEMEFGFGQGTHWIKHDVEQKIKQMLTSYIPLLKVTYTRNYNYVPAPIGKDPQLFEVMYNRGFTIPVLKPNRNLEAKFAYLPWWNPYFHLNCNGQLCQPEGISSTLGFLFGVRRYQFAYDISYPVLVDIKSPDAFGGEGYTFRYFLEANMRNNVPLATAEPPLKVLQHREQESLLCDQRTGGNITMNVQTSSEKQVDNAEITYRCGEETCNIGTSVNGKLVATFPRCVGGFIVATHEEYASSNIPLDILDRTPQTVDISLAEPYVVDFAAKKWLLKKTGGNWDVDTNNLASQGPRENTLILLKRKGSDYEEPILIVGEICGAPGAKASIPCGTPPSDTSKDITIYPGDYHVTIYSFHYPAPELEIPPNRRCFSYRSSTGSKKRKCYWVPEKSVIFDKENPLYSGHAEFDWTITDYELARAKTIEFYYINFALDKVRPAQKRIIEDLEVMGNLAKYSEQYKYLLEPRVIQ